MKKTVILTTLAALAVFTAIFGYKYYTVRLMIAAMSSRTAPAVTVSTAPAQPAVWQGSLGAVGSVESYQGITVRSEVEGRITKIAFDSGAVVQAGDLLVDLDAASEQAQLKSLIATARLAELSLQRARDLRTNGTNTAADLDTAEANSAQAAAAVESLQVTLAKKHIVAPFAGSLGIRQVNLGQFLNKADAVVTLEAIDPAYVDFAVPQQEISRIQPGLPVTLTVDAFPGRTFAGRIEAINPRITTETRNVRLRAIVPNSDGSLRPGLFGRVVVELPEKADVLVIPATAIVYSSYGDSVYVATEQPAADGKPATLVARQQFVTVGTARGDLIAVVKGLKAGEQIVTSGQIKLRNGSLIQINNANVPAADAAPKPNES